MMRVWHIAALVGVGLVVGAIWPGELAVPFRHATLVLFLPALIFEGAWQLDPRAMLANARSILLLVLPGVVLTALLVGFSANVFGGMALGAALLLGAIVSATDPVAVTAIFKRVRVPHELATIVTGESLLNDAIAVVLYQAMLAAVTVGVTVGGLEQIGINAIIGVVMGLISGIAFGLAAALIARPQLGAFLQSAVSFAAAYAVYFFCERLDWSGIFAVIACAIVLRRMDRHSSTTDVAKVVDRFWGGAATIANAILFLLIGASVEALHLVTEPAIIVAAVAAALASRFVLAYGLLALVPRLQRGWKTIVRLAGVRGALSLALALALPAALHQRQMIVDATFAVVVITLVLGSLAIEPRIEKLDLGA